MSITALALFSGGLDSILACRVVNAEVFPIAREISDEIRQKVDEYLFRKEPKD